MVDKLVILPTDDCAATPAQMTLYRSIDGSIYISEEAARYASSTHKLCECGNITLKFRVYCAVCEERIERETYLKKKSKKIVIGEDLLYSARLERFFKYPYEILQDGEDYEDPKIDDKFLIAFLVYTTNPVYAAQLDADFFDDCLPDDRDDLPSELADAIDVFNKAVDGLVCSYVRSDFRAVL